MIAVPSCSGADMVDGFEQVLMRGVYDILHEPSSCRVLATA